MLIAAYPRGYILSLARHGINLQQLYDAAIPIRPCVFVDTAVFLICQKKEEKRDKEKERERAPASQAYTRTEMFLSSIVL